MALSTKPIDEARHGKHFKHVHISYPDINSKTRDFFYIDHVRVDEKVFWESYNQEQKEPQEDPREKLLEDILGRQFARLSRVLECYDWRALQALDPNSPEVRAVVKSLDLTELEEIEAELSPEDQKFVAQQKAKYEFPKGHENKRLHLFIQSASALSTLLERQLTNQMGAQIEELKNLSL